MKNIKNRKQIFLNLFFLINILLFSMNLSGQSAIIEVTNQTDFDNLNEQLNSLIDVTNTGTIDVIFESGRVFRFNDGNRIRIINRIKRNVKLKFTSSNMSNPAKIISDGMVFDTQNIENREETNDHYVYDYKKENVPRYTKNELFLDQDFNPVPISDSGYLGDSIPNMNCANSYPHLDTDTTIARVELKDGPLTEIINDKGSEIFKNSRMHWPVWYVGIVSDVIECKNKELFFKHNLPNTEKFHELVNDGEGYSEKKIIFYLTNVGEPEKGKIFISSDDKIYIPKTISTLYEMRYRQFMFAREADFEEIEICNLDFLGSALTDHTTWELDSEANNAGLEKATIGQFSFHNVNNLNVHHCKFRNLGNETSFKLFASLHPSDYSEKSGSSNLKFHDNEAAYCHGYLLLCWGVDDVKIYNNESKYTGITHKFNGVYDVWGKNFDIHDNTIKNFSYAGIRISGPPGAFAKNFGIIERNLLYYDDDYIQNYNRYTIKDQGAIYIWTHNDDTIIKHNVIHDIIGRTANAGIYCDDGAYGYTIDSNLIFNIYNEHAIVSPYYGNINVVEEKGIFPSTKNKMKNNIILGTYRFQGNPEKMSGDLCCVKNTNYLGGVFNRGVDVLNLCINEADIIDPLARVDKDQVILYDDIPFYNELPTFIKNRIVQCEAVKLTKYPQFKASNNFMRLETLNLNGYESSSYTVQNSNITPSGEGATRWTTAYKLDEDIEIEVNDDFQLIETKFAIIGMPYNESELTRDHYPVKLAIKNNGSSLLRDTYVTNPIKKGMDDMIYVRDGDKFRTPYVPMNQLKGIVFEALATSDIKLGVEIKCISKSTGENHILRENFPILKTYSNPTYKYLTIGRGQSNFSMSDYWAEADEQYLWYPSNSTYIGRKIIMENGFVGQAGFVAKASYTKNEIGNTRISFIERCEGQYINRSVSRSGLLVNRTTSTLSDMLLEDSNLLIYPNPSDGIFYIRGLETDAECGVDVYDISGKKVYSAKNLKTGDQIDMQGKPKGIYMTRISINGKTFTEKLILK